MLIIRNRETKIAFCTLPDDEEYVENADGFFQPEGHVICDLPNLEAVTGEAPTDITFYSGLVAYDTEWSIADLQGYDNMRKMEPAYLEAQAVDERVKRDGLLSETDWWTSTDQTASEDQLLYRQALRDVPSQVTFPFHINWPVKP